MARQSRIDAPGALHHIIARSIERKRIFTDSLGETSREHHGGLTPARARTVPGLNSTGKWLW